MAKKKEVIVAPRTDLPKPVEPNIKLNKKQLDYVLNYYDPNSETFGNSYRSAQKAGFSKKYAKTIMQPAVNNLWIIEARKRMTNFTPDHIYQSLQDVALTGEAKDKLRALELMGKANGMFVDRQQRDVTVTFTNTVPRPKNEIIDVEVEDAQH